MEERKETTSSGRIIPRSGINDRIPYEHQKKAMECMDRINSGSDFSTLVVLPTGGGKTYTAALWLLHNAIDQHKKILWIAHRQMLLDQAAEAFQRYAYTETIPHISGFRYRIISGSSSHGRTIDIRRDDDLLIVSKDSIGRSLSALDDWLAGEEELFLVVDEAHHSTAKTYRRVIDYVRSKIPHVKLIGLTATPFRTAEDEQGLLGKIYTDGVKNNAVVHNDVGITYQISLKDLISRRILAKPVFESYQTEEQYGQELGLEAWESIQHLDTLPDDVARQIAGSALRNRLIVDTYQKGQQKYGQTIVFAVNVDHAIALNALFRKSGISSDYIVSSIRDAATGVNVSREDNERKLQAYRDGKLQVLINVNILTEGVDLPKTGTVFLARPTVSTILMTQMVGRALRGPAAGGTDTAYIVSFVDNWDEHIAWVNPESLFDGNNEFSDNMADRIQREVRMISLSKIEEFATMLDSSINTTALEKVPFTQRIPIGMYAFSYLEENGMDLSCQVMVYDSTAEAYRQMMADLPALFASFGVTEEYLPDDVLRQMERQCRDTYFCGEMVPPYSSDDAVRILKYYAQYEAAPSFYTFDHIDRSRLDVGAIAKHIWDEDMGQRKAAEYVESLWNQGDDNLLRLFFGRKLYFMHQVEIEKTKLAHPDTYNDTHITYDTIALEDLPLREIGKLNPQREKELRDGAFAKARTSRDTYRCACCGMEAASRIPFQVDHILPMNRGGKSVPENLQILCRSCNGRKGDQ